MRIAMSVCVYYYLDHLFPKHGGGGGVLTQMRIPMSVIVFYSFDRLFSQTWRGFLTEMRIAMSVYVYYSLDQLFPQHGRGFSQKWELQCLYVYIIPLISYFPNMEGVSHRNENCNVCMCILLPWWPISQTWRGGGGCTHGNENSDVCNCILFLWSSIFPNMEGVSHRNENCNVCICILFPWSAISPTWKGFLTEMRIAMSVCVYYSLDHLFLQHGRGFSQKWELQCLYVYIIPLITYFPNMEGVAHINENCNVCMCILIPWSHISQARRGLLREMRVAMSVCVYYSFDHLFPQHGRGFSQKWELQCLYVYIITLMTYFPNMEGGGGTHGNENSDVCNCILFLWSSIFPNMEGVSHRNENCNVCICILFPWSAISPTWKGFLTEMRIAMSVCVYYSLDHLFLQHGRGFSQKWELQCLYVYIIPLITYFPNMEGVAHINENCKVYMCILFPWSPIFPTWRGLLTKLRNAMSVCVYYSFDRVFPVTWRGLLREMRIPMSVCVYYSFDHLFPQHGGGCSQKWELQCQYVYIIPFITYFPNMEGVSQKMREMGIAMAVCVYYSLDHLFP